LKIGVHGYDTYMNKDNINNFYVGMQNKYIPVNFTDSQTPIQLENSMPIYLANEKSKKCMSLKFSLEDVRHIMFKTNFIYQALRKFVINETFYKNKLLIIRLIYLDFTL
jgi:hypothetical protein